MREPIKPFYLGILDILHLKDLPKKYQFSQFK